MLNPLIQKILDAEQQRQSNTLDLIASENYTSKAVREAVGSIFMHKYSEGYPGARYYEGNENIDDLENLCIRMVKKVFELPNEWGVNVQALAGSNANLSVYNALLNPGDTILSMYLPDGGHLSHGWSYTTTKERTAEEIEALQSEDAYLGGKTKISIVSKIYKVVQYKVNKETNLFDYDSIEKLALEYKPKLIVTGGTAYVRDIDYKRVSEIARKVNAYYLADVAHEAGLIAGKVLSSPMGIADVVTFTTHKTLRGPKGAVICAKGDVIELINKAVMPGFQGGPHNGTIAGITQCLFEADTEEFKIYSEQIIKNAKAMANRFSQLDYRLITNGTDKHSLLIDLTNKGISGKYASYALNKVGIVSNMNTIPFETKSPLNPSGIRLGTPSITTRGLKEEDCIKIADLINRVIEVSASLNTASFDEFKGRLNESKLLDQIKSEVLSICKTFPFKD